MWLSLGRFADSLEHVLEAALRHSPVCDVKTLFVLLDQEVEVLGLETLDWHLEDEVAVKFLDQYCVRQLLLDEVIQSPSHILIINVIALGCFLLIINEVIILRVLFILSLVRNRWKALALLLLLFSKKLQGHAFLAVDVQMIASSINRLQSHLRCHTP